MRNTAGQGTGTKGTPWTNIECFLLRALLTDFLGCWQWNHGGRMYCVMWRVILGCQLLFACRWRRWTCRFFILHSFHSLSITHCMVIFTATMILLLERQTILQRSTLPARKMSVWTDQKKGFLVLRHSQSVEIFEIQIQKIRKKKSRDLWSLSHSLSLTTTRSSLVSLGLSSIHTY